ncbi:SNF2 family N-terminal domain-containing protein [Dunaliella salina]|uniref:SNF2 family N-terminal domain-containing protein n=1 Tax=Dunaliella salina TaxID=3046 RepID=A0ABQ7GXJ5_DUNSA|nr:SNF2 family N-terminal domain-containing protein [Dunaliella salina]|eukprot:KAF5839335.1 SNF2 family N-terminal domain-containing protein [Dunaliella salina]
MYAGRLVLPCRVEASPTDVSTGLELSYQGKSLTVRQAGAHTVGTCACPFALLALRQHLDLRVNDLQLPPHRLPLQQQPLLGNLCIDVHLLDSFFLTTTPAAEQQRNSSRGSRGKDKTCAQGQAVLDLLQSVQRHGSAAAGSGRGSGSDGSSDEDEFEEAGAGAEGVADQAMQQPAATGDRGDHNVPPACNEDEEAASAAAATAGGHDVRDEIFEIARPSAWKTEAANPPGLGCSLFRYQRRALAWMLWREQQDDPGEACGPSSAHGPHAQAPHEWPADGRLSLVWREVTLQSGARVWVNQLDGSALKQDPELAGLQLPPVRGGMLCDEMGLGKTVEVIALLLTHMDDVSARGKPRALAPSSGAAGEGNTKVWGPTLIVTPPAILQQWAGEIRDHSNNLKVVIYDGIKDKQEEMAKSQKADIRRCQRAIAKAESDLAKAEDALREAQQKRQKLGNGEALPVQCESAGGKGQRGRGRSSSRGRGVGTKRKASSELPNPEQAVEERSSGLHAAKAALEALEQQQEANTVANQAVQELVQADVVLTTYNVLGQEVHFNLDSLRVQGSLRHAKRYQVPETPLLQVAWHRLVLDEAQHCGKGLSVVAQMAGQLVADRRWCVTGTPIGPGGLQDIFGSLRALQAYPLSVPSVFRRLVSGPYMSGSLDGHHRLRTLIKPYMWRNSKAATSGDIQLPARTLAIAPLAMPSLERAFYDHVLEEARSARTALLRQQQQQLHQQQEQQEQQEQEQPDSALDQQAGQPIDELAQQQPDQAQQQQQQQQQQQRQRQLQGQRGGQRKRGQSSKAKNKGAEPAELAHGSLTQLRLACVHPQLTQYWTALSSELQLNHAGGGALSMVDILKRMWDQAQMHLQAAEREYCTIANVLAAKLLEEADKRNSALAAGSSSAKKVRGSAKRARTCGSPQQQQRLQGPNLDGPLSVAEIPLSGQSGTAPSMAAAGLSTAGLVAAGASPNTATLSVAGPSGSGGHAVAAAAAAAAQHQHHHHHHHHHHHQGDAPSAGAPAEVGRSDGTGHAVAAMMLPDAGACSGGPSANNGLHRPAGAAGADAELSGAVTASLYKSALDLIEGSYRVGEKGIAALDKGEKRKHVQARDKKAGD